jgi:predicted nucleotidyltransferase
MSIFGSVARQEAQPHDVDIAVRLAENFAGAGFEYFGRLEDLRIRLVTILGSEVDVLEELVRNKRQQNEIDKDRVIAF